MVNFKNNEKYIKNVDGSSGTSVISFRISKRIKQLIIKHNINPRTIIEDAVDEIVGIKSGEDDTIEQ
jgi:hypothetical protein